MFKTNLIIALRNLRKNWVYALLNIGGLGIGLASCLILILYVAYEWSYDKQFEGHDKIFVAYNNQTGNGKIFSFPATPEALGPTIQSSVKGVSAVTRVYGRYGSREVIRYKDKVLDRDNLYVDPNFLDVFSYGIREGNRHTALSDISAIVLTRSFAKTLFGNQDPMGQIVRWNDSKDLKVTAVLEDPPSNCTIRFDYLLSWDLFVSNNPWVKQNPWTSNFAETFVVLDQPGGLEAANREISPLLNANQDSYKGTIFLFPFTDWHLHSRFDGGKSIGGEIDQIRLLSILAIFILVIACVNFMNLSTARSQQRCREVGVRKAIGSSRVALIRQFLAESLMISFLSMLLAIILLELSMGYFNEILNLHLDIHFRSFSTWAAILALIAITGVLAGSYPAFYLSSFKPISVLKGAFKNGKGSLSIRRCLVVFQFVFAIGLIVCTAVIYEQIRFIRDRPIGYDKHQLVTIPMNGDLGSKPEVFKNELIRSGAIIAATPMSISLTTEGYNGWGVSWPGKDPNEKVLFDFLNVGYDFAKTTGVHLIEGRDFSRDFASDSGAILVNQTAARIMGLKQTVGTVMTGNPPLRIIGVFEDLSKGQSAKMPNPMVVYLSPGWGGVLTARLNPAMGVHNAVAAIEAVEKRLNPAFPPSVSFVDKDVEDKLSNEKLLGTLSNLFGALSIFICCLGLFGLALFTTEQRTKEISIRKVLGASMGSLIALLSRDFLVLVAIAGCIGCPLAYLGMRQWLDKYDFHVSIGWIVFALAFGVALLVAVLSVLWQSWKAALMQPVKGLKYE